MKTTHLFYRLLAAAIGMSFLLFLITGCGKDSETNLPELTTSAVSAITSNSATSGGNITSDGGTTVSARGVCWSTDQTPDVSDDKTTDGDGTGAFTSNLTGLIPDTTYYVRAYATNSKGTGYGNIISFATEAGEPGTITDIDGNVYHTLTINSQVWLKENLKVTHYRNGDPVTPGKANALLTSLADEGAYYDYNNDPANSEIYGRLYDWYALVNASVLAPEGFHVASYEEWTTMVDYLGGPDVAGEKLKEEGSAHWSIYNIATNETGFTALPAGIWDNTSDNFTYLGEFNMIWTSTEIHDWSAYTFVLTSGAPSILHGEGFKHMGYSIRCLMD